MTGVQTCALPICLLDSNGADKTSSVTTAASEEAVVVSLDGGAPAVVVRDDPADVVVGGRSMREIWDSGRGISSLPRYLSTDRGQRELFASFEYGTREQFWREFCGRVEIVYPCTVDGAPSPSFWGPTPSGNLTSYTDFLP